LSSRSISASTTSAAGGALAQRGDRRGDLGHPLTGQVAGDLGGDDGAGGVGVGGRGARRRLTLDAVHVDDDHVGQPGHRGVHVARHPEVADHELLGGVHVGHAAVHIGQRDDRADRAGATDHDIGIGQQRR